MNVFVDTNVLVAAVTKDTDRSANAVELLNTANETYTSILNLMELRSVLAKKKGFDRERIDRIEDRIVNRSTVTFPDASDIIAANSFQAETLCYPMDALVLIAARTVGVPLVTFDSELIAQGAKQPSELL